MCSSDLENKGGSWSIPMKLETTFEAKVNNAPLANSSDGNNLYLFSDGQIYESYISSYGWSEFKLMNDNINTSAWEGDLTISSDNNSLIFARGNASLEKNIDIVFLVDATGSMGPCISGVQENIYNFIDGIKEDNTIVN